MKTYTRILLVAGLCLPVFGEAPAASAQPSGFDVARASLDANRCVNRRTPGRLKIRATVSDADTRSFWGDLLAPDVDVTVRVQDSGSFDTQVTLVNCEPRGATSIRCIGLDPTTGQRVKAFVREFRGGKFDDVFVFSMRVKDLTTADTGSPPLTAPVTVTLQHGSRVRVDQMAETSAAECRQKKKGCTLRCRASN